MHVKEFVSRWLGGLGGIKHAARRDAVVRVVVALLNGGRLSLTHLGRRRPGRAFPKHHIKAVDRLLGNRHLHEEKGLVYRQLARRMLIGVARPVIIVDWADFELDRAWLMLRAAVPIKGRALPIFERVFPFKRYNSPGAHEEFLAGLKQVLPEGCNPIIVTDAGFRGPWFKAVEAFGWDWVGRIRNRIKYLNESTSRWCYTDSLYPLASPEIRHVGMARLGRRKSYSCNLYLVRAHEVRRGRPRKRRRPSSNQGLYRRLHRAPWLLATSLPSAEAQANRIKAIYEKRMQIEESFRDLKCHRWGFSARYTRSRSAERLEALLLIAAIASLVVWLAGLIAGERGLVRRFQANTEVKRRVLSVVFVGAQFLRTLPDELSLPDFLAAIPLLRRSVCSGAT